MGEASSQTRSIGNYILRDFRPEGLTDFWSTAVAVAMENAFGFMLPGNQLISMVTGYWMSVLIYGGR